MMKKIFILFIVFVGVSGCFQYKNTPRVVYYYQTNKMIECMTPVMGYSIYEYYSPFVGVADMEEHIPAHYQILLPHQKDVKRTYGINHNRCFVYSKGRGVAIIQEFYNKNTGYENGLHEISMDDAERWLSKAVDMHETMIKMKDNRHHYLYVDNEIGIVMFNLTEKDYHDFVELPTNNLSFYQRGEMRLRN